MTEFFAEMFQPVNMPATVLMLIVAAYWLMVIFGTVGLDLFDIDLSIDAEGGVEDLPIGMLPEVLGFFNVGKVPVTILGSVFALVLWTTTMMGNQILNPDAFLQRGILIMGVVAFASLFVTKLLTWPLVPVFESMNREEVERLKPGTMARITSTDVSDSFGEVMIERSGPPVVLNARCYGARLQQGEIVQLISFDSDNNTWLVQLPKK